MYSDIIVLIDDTQYGQNHFKEVRNELPRIKKMKAEKLDIDTLRKAAKMSMSKTFFVVDKNTVFDLADLDSLSIDEFDAKYVNIWNTNTDIGTIIFTSKTALAESKQAEVFEEVGLGVKYREESVGYKRPYDVFFISYDEPNAEENWEQLIQKVPYAKRVHRVKGIFNAHKAAAEQSASKMFFVVDGDSEIVDGFDFSLEIFNEESKYVHIWKARNPVNGLEYGYGGLKLFCTDMFENMTGEMPLDMSTLIGNGVKLIDTVASITRFDSSAFHTYRGAFRECAKLASKQIKNQVDEETDARLEAWLDNGFGKYGTEAKTGALEGMRFGRAYKNNQAMLAKINDYEWLYEQYANTFK